MLPKKPARTKLTEHRNITPNDTGAGLSIIDMGTLEHMNLVPYIDTTTNYAEKCLDASGSNMNIIGTIELNTERSVYNQEAYAIICATRHWYVYLVGNKFTLNSDHNPLTHLLKKKDPRGKVARWIAELETFQFNVEYISGKKNIKAGALSRNENAGSDLPFDWMEGQMYALLAKECVSNNVPMKEGQLKKYAKQLRIEKDVLTKSGRAIIPPNMRLFVFEQYHKTCHLGLNKLYEIMKKRIFWPNMRTFIANELALCTICAQCKADTKSLKAPLLPIYEPTAPMDFISLDIGYMPTDINGYQYILMIGDLFSKYIEVIPLRDQTASTITSALWEKWIMKYGSPKFLLTDQGSNVDGSILAKLCQGFNIEKRRTSGYHSQCNGFAERNIRSVKELFRTALIEFQLPQIMWKDILPSIVFALNTSVNASTKCAPYTVIYGRQPRLPIDILLDVDVKQMSAPNPTEYLKDMKIQIRDILSHVSKNLNISRMSMMRQYNKNVKFFDYQAGDKVWVKRRHYKPGENRKLSPRNTGPWTIELKKNEWCQL